jgi:DegV family protein with EDD domain
MIRIVTDSTCDLPQETIRKYDIRVVPLFINIGDKGYLDGVDISREEFYRNLPAYPTQPTTAVPSIEKFRAAYEELAREGATEILSIHISATLSAVTDVARVAAQEIKSTPVTVFDSRQLSLGTGFLVELAAQLAAQGKAMGEIVAALNEQIKRSRVFAALDTLEFLKRSGRMNGVIANFGTLLQLKPILTMFDGKAGAERVRTRERAMQRVLEMLHDAGALERVAIVHSHAPERVIELRKRAAHLLPDGDILTMNITPVIGAHIGPGAVGFAVVSKRN